MGSKTFFDWKNKVTTLVNTILVDYLKKTDIEDSVSSTSTVKPLSANQGKALKGLIDGKVNSADLHAVATSGNYNDLNHKPSIPSKTSQLTNDSGFLTTNDVSGSEITVDLTNYVQKSNTSGLLKNDGTVDTNNYLTQHQSLANYIQKSNTSGLLKNDGTVDTNNYLTQHQSLANYIQKSNTSGLIKNDGTIDTTQYLSEIPDYTLVQTLTKNGYTAKVYSDGQNVYIKYSGTGTLTEGANLNMGTLNNLDYAPKSGYEYGMIRHGGLDLMGAVDSNGTVYIINKASNTSPEIYGSIMYPLKSRLP